MLKITEHRISFFDDSGLAIIPVVQGDTGRVLKLTPTDAELTNSYTAKWFARKPSGLAVYYDATILSGSVYCQLTAQALAEKGDTFLNVRIYDQNEDVVSAFRVCLDVQESPVDAIESTNETNIFDQAVEEAIEEIGNTLDTTLSVQNKAAEAKTTGDAIRGVVESIIPTHDEDTIYYMGDACKYGNNYYICSPKAGMAVSGEFDQGDWVQIASMRKYLARALTTFFECVGLEYNSSKTYAVGDFCFRYGSLKRCITAIATPESYTNGHWETVTIPGLINEVKIELSEDEDGFIEISMGG